VVEFCFLIQPGRHFAMRGCFDEFEYASMGGIKQLNGHLVYGEIVRESKCWRL
jgi:hypothetical protein